MWIEKQSEKLYSLEDSKKNSLLETANILENITKDWKIDSWDNEDLQKLLDEYSEIKKEHKDFLDKIIEESLENGFTVENEQSFNVILKYFEKKWINDFPKYQDLLKENNWNNFSIVKEKNGLKVSFYNMKNFWESAKKFWEFIFFNSRFVKSTFWFDYKANNNEISSKYRVTMKDYEDELANLEPGSEEYLIIQNKMNEKLKQSFQNRMDAFLVASEMWYIPYLVDFQKENDSKMQKINEEINQNNEKIKIVKSYKILEDFISKNSWNKKLSEEFRKNLEWVKALQTALNILNPENNLVVDWKYWVETSKAILEFQRLNWLKTDWIVWKKTLNALLENDTLKIAKNKDETKKS